jgi:hypothetical protein
MRLWMLRPLKDDSAPWLPYYDCMFGFVVRAATEEAARSLAASNCGDEGPDAWLSGRSSTCVELKADGPAGVIMEEYNTERPGQMTNGRAMVA